MSGPPIVDATAFNESALRVVAAHREVIAGAVQAIIEALHSPAVQDDGDTFDALHRAAAMLNASLANIDGENMQARFARGLQ